ncbi:MAG: chromosomal replication initiator protein DnaA [Candidatus Taylorbacteria bacterium]|nr:chromosomal replication initiator protein DnaA [Candidatus Taylorbacteria bacterium]
MNDLHKLWDSILVEIELTVSKANFSTWFKDTHILKRDEGAIYLSVPNAFVKDWLLKKYHAPILKSLRTFDVSIRSLEYIITKDDSRRKESDRERTAPQNWNSELPLADYYINKDDNLNPKYTFESFVVGPFNELAHAAAQAIIKKPSVYNPLFIYGDTGHGKTHLIQAIGNHMKGAHSQKKVFYMTSEKFAVDCTNSIQAGKMNNFKEKYRKYDTLIMDDIQFLSNKEKIQEELFHLFNSLHENNKQIVFSSDKHPNYIPNLEERLKSRFAAGMIVDIPTPDLESRVAILKSKSTEHNCPLSSEIIDYLAQTVDGNIRELEGVLNTIICQSQVKGKELSLNEIKNLIKNTAKPKKVVAVKDIVKTVADFYNIEEESIYDKTRKKEVVKPRQLIMYILREDFNISYPSIGEKLGGRDHTTVIHSCGKIKEELKVNNLLAQEISQLRSMF